MRWTSRGAHVVLQLRAAALTNNRWNAFWRKISLYGVKIEADCAWRLGALAFAPDTMGRFCKNRGGEFPRKAPRWRTSSDTRGATIRVAEPLAASPTRLIILYIIWESHPGGAPRGREFTAEAKAPRKAATATRGGLHNKRTDREAAMRQFMMSLTALATFGAKAATAQAEVLHGGPTQKGNQCFKYSPGNEKDGTFGIWGACPQTAGVRTSSRPLPARTAAPPRLLPPPGPDRQLQARDGMRYGSPSPAASNVGLG
jgi:hypothetical protein